MSQNEIKLSTDELEAIKELRRVDPSLPRGGRKCYAILADEAILKARATPLSDAVNRILVQVQTGKRPITFVDGVVNFA